jgi:hypothetical protein
MESQVAREAASFRVRGVGRLGFAKSANRLACRMLADGADRPQWRYDERAVASYS